LDVQRMSLQARRDPAIAGAFLDDRLHGANPYDESDEHADETCDRTRDGVRQALDQALTRGERSTHSPTTPRIRALIASYLVAARRQGQYLRDSELVAAR